MKQLKSVQKLQLNLALEVQRICNKHDIRYFLIFGTLLGAVRHKGFIPWDDDLDIGMLRPDYERFIKIAENEISAEYFLQTWDTDKHFGFPFAKLMVKNTKYIEKIAVNVNIYKGVFIDIFPFDNVPNAIWQQKLHMFTTFTLKKLLLIKNNYNVTPEKQKTVKRILYYFTKFTIRFISVDLLKNLLSTQMVKFNSLDAKYVIPIGSSYGYKKEKIKKEWFDELKLIEFEGSFFLCPSRYDEYLTHLYGDYMVPPPEEKRCDRHSIIEVKLGDQQMWKK